MCRTTMDPTNPRPVQYMELLAHLYRERFPDTPQPQQRQDSAASSLPSSSSPSATTTRQQRRKVSFSFIVVETSKASSGPLFKDEVKDLWYDKKEIAMFKIQARKSILSCFTSNDDGISTGTMKRKLNTNQIDSLRGLEGCTMERHMYRLKSIRCTLAAIKRGMNEETVSGIYQSCSTWNVQIAKNQASYDYYAAYKPNQMHLNIPRMSNIPPKFPFTSKRLTTTTSTMTDECDVTNKNQFERRVRQRIGP